MMKYAITSNGRYRRITTSVSMSAISGPATDSAWPSSILTRGATREKFINDWMRTGDYGRKDKDGNFWFSGRQDDIIESGGFRIGPGEVEDCLMKHPAVALVGVIGVSDPVRGEIVKAFILPQTGVTPDKALEQSIQEHVKKRLEAHAYPREVAFVDEMPRTSTGKILRKELRALHGQEAKINN